MELKIWSPFTDMEKEWRLDFPRFLFGEPAAGFRPSIDILETEGGLTITAELPGVRAEDVDVSLDGRVLTIKGEKSEEREVDDKNRYLRERTFGAFERRIPLPEGVSADKISADFDKGVLTIDVTMPDEVLPQPQTIEVKAT